MDKMNITSAQYRNDPITNETLDIVAIIDGLERCVPLSLGNRHFAEIMRQVEAGELTIQDAD